MMKSPFVILAVLLTLIFAGCSGLSGIASEATDTGDTSSSTDTESLTGDESSLYEDGPVSIPVTIAKLDSVNADLVTVEFTGTDSSSELKALSQSSSEDGYDVTGLTGAVNTGQATKLFLINTDAGTSDILTVESDGAFSGFISAEEGQIIAIAPMVEEETEIGPPIYADSETGVSTIALTNANNINSDANLEISTDGYAYFSAEVSDGTYTIYRRNLDGTALETVVTGITSQIRFLTVDPQGSFNYITQDGRVFSVFIENPTVPLAVTGKPPLKTEFGEPWEILDLGDSLEQADGFTPPGTKVMRTSIGTSFVGNRSNQTAESFQDTSTSLLTFIDTTANPIQNTEILPKSEYSDAVFDVGSQDTLFLFVSEHGDNDVRGAYELYRVAMLDGAEAWNNRVSVYALDQSPHVLWMDVSDEDFIVYVVGYTGSNTRDFYTLLEGEEPYLITTTSDGDAIRRSEWISLKPDSTLANARLVTCSTSQSTQRSYITLHRVGIDLPGEFYRLTNAETKAGCAGAYTIDQTGKILFYRATYDTDGNVTEPQISFININNIDESMIVLDE